MKRSIKRLPKRTQEELAVLQELILQYLVNVRMIILYGSYARGEYVIWDETYDERGGLTYYQSDLDILVICDTGDAVKAENHANAFVVPKYDKRMEGKRHPAPPQIIVESTTTVNRAIRRKHYFSQLYTLLYQRLYIMTGWTLMCQSAKSQIGIFKSTSVVF